MNTANGGQIIGGTVTSLSITMNQVSNAIVEGAMRATCDTYGHRFAWLTYGGAECVRCGARG